MNLIHIVDNLNDEEYIYSNGLTISLEQAAISLVYKLKDTKWSLLQNVEYNICEDKCEIFINEQIIERGWVWNSKNMTKKILYKLSYISLFSVEEKPKQIEQSVQTEEIVDNYIDYTNCDNYIDYTNCDNYVDYSADYSDYINYTDYVDYTNYEDVVRQQTENLYIKNTNVDIYNYGGFFNVGDYKIDLGLGYSNNPFDPVNNLSSKTNIWSDPNHKYAINYTVPLDDTLLMEDPEKRIISDLNIEIKRRLALPNFGLRRFKQD